ncbi:ecdysteroid-phosphate phosphatase-like [Macrobrachium rosenbergii]|uniref:ecdysteroid-phosphate phosphatase-like n=1 Tax=Macrobrachium rosenbergii TaxID=79674 RepID=UPI0034D5C1AE
MIVGLFYFDAVENQQMNIDKARGSSTEERSLSSTHRGLGLIVVRHGERLEQVDRNWFEKYKENDYDGENAGDFYPKVLPVRRNREDYRTDAPLTKRGQDDARAMGSVMKTANITSIYVSPAYRCLETARKIIEGASLQHVELKLEPGLLEWIATFGGKFPEVFSRQELLDAGFNISQEYKPYMEATFINRKETTKDYYERTHHTLMHCLEDHEDTAREGTVLIVAHQMTVLTIPTDSAKARFPFFLELVSLGGKLPYLGHVWLSKVGKIWHDDYMAFAKKEDKQKYLKFYNRIQFLCLILKCKLWDKLPYFVLNSIIRLNPKFLTQIDRLKKNWDRLTFDEELSEDN